VFGLYPDDDYIIWGVNNNHPEPFKNEYRAKSCFNLDWENTENV